MISTSLFCLRWTRWRRDTAYGEKSHNCWCDWFITIKFCFRCKQVVCIVLVI